MGQKNEVVQAMRAFERRADRVAAERQADEAAPPTAERRLARAHARLQAVEDFTAFMEANESRWLKVRRPSRRGAGDGLRRSRARTRSASP
jgi:hypothetical protein